VSAGHVGYKKLRRKITVGGVSMFVVAGTIPERLEKEELKNLAFRYKTSYG
jgi:hypothetical protein